MGDCMSQSIKAVELIRLHCSRVLKKVMMMLTKDILVKSWLGIGEVCAW